MSEWGNLVCILHVYMHYEDILQIKQETECNLSYGVFAEVSSTSQ